MRAFGVSHQAVEKFLVCRQVRCAEPVEIVHAFALVGLPVARPSSPKNATAAVQTSAPLNV